MGASIETAQFGSGEIDAGGDTLGPSGTVVVVRLTLGGPSGGCAFRAPNPSPFA